MRCKMNGGAGWTPIPKWMRYDIGVIVTIFVGIAIWYMIQ
jgi:hypothetical protein